MKKNNKSKVNSWKSNFNNRLYFFTSILILIILFAVVIYFTKQPIIAGKVFSVVYKDNTEGKFPLIITFTKDDSGVLTKEATFLDGINEFVFSIDDIVNNKIQIMSVLPKVEEGGSVCGNDACDVGEDKNTCPQDCINYDLDIDSVTFTDTGQSIIVDIAVTNKGTETFSTFTQSTFAAKINDKQFSVIFKLEQISPEETTSISLTIEDYDSLKEGFSWEVNLNYNDKDNTNNLETGTYTPIPELELNKLFEPPADGSWGSWVGTKGKVTITCSETNDMESGNEYINNPFIPGTTTLDAMYDFPSTNVAGNWITEHYCDITQGYFYGHDYDCPTSGRYITTISNKEVAACYCTLDTQCGYGWTCDLAQGDGDDSKGKCVKNP